MLTITRITHPAHRHPEAAAPRPAGAKRTKHDAIGNIVGKAIIRLIGAVLLEANDEWQTQNRYMQTEPMAELMATSTKPETVRISTAAA